jgi:hypothetical protein
MERFVSVPHVNAEMKFHVLMFVLVMCRGQFGLCLLSFSSTGSTFNCSKISSFCEHQKVCVPLLF